MSSSGTILEVTEVWYAEVVQKPRVYMDSTMPDPVIDQIREIRHRISASCDHDPAKLVAYLMRYQEQFRDRLIYHPPEHAAAEQTVEPDTGKGGESALVRH
jgi:hypothetical protein